MSRPHAKPDDAARPQGLVERVVDAYWAFSDSARRLLAERPSETILLSFMVIAGVVRFMGLMAGEVLAGGSVHPAAAQDGLVGALIVGPLGVYLLAWLATPVLRWIGGSGDGYATRLALAWSLIVSAPALFVASALDGAEAGLRSAALADGAEAGFWAGAGLSLASLLLAAYICGACIAGAHGFRSGLRVALGIGGAVAGVAALASLAVGLAGA